MIEALHGAHPLNELETPERGTWYDSRTLHHPSTRSEPRSTGL